MAFPGLTKAFDHAPVAKIYQPASSD